MMLSEFENDGISHDVPRSVIKTMYIAMLDAENRLETGTALLRECLVYLETNHECKCSVDTRTIEDV